MPEREKGWCAEMKRLNPSWEHVVFGNEIMETYGQDPYVRALQSLDKPKAFIVDRLRMLLLRDRGGIWLDPDCQPVRPLDTISFAWDSSFTFIYSARSPDRPDVALHRGVTLFDNTFLASAPNSRMCQRILSLWRPQNVVIDGHAVGVEILRHHNLGMLDAVSLPYHYFYNTQMTPETIVLHDNQNLASWVAQTKAEQRARMIA